MSTCVQHSATPDDPDFCQVCGIMLTNTFETPASQAPPAPVNANNCPNCALPLDKNAKRCSCCNYDLVRKRKTEPQPVQVVASEPSMPDRWHDATFTDTEDDLDEFENGEFDSTAFPPIGEELVPIIAEAETEDGADVEPTPINQIFAVPQLPAAERKLQWVATVKVDKSVFEAEKKFYDEGTPLPKNFPDVTYLLKAETTLIGRGDDDEGIYPGIRVRDNAVSRSHAILQLQPDGSLFLTDLGKAGTKIQGESIVPNSAYPMVDGSEFTLGRWTKVKVETLK